MFAGAAAAAKSRSVIIHITPAHGRGSGWSLPAPVLAAVSAVLLRTAGVVSFSMENNHDETDGSDTKVTTARARFYVRMLASLVITDILELLARAVPADLAQQYLMVSALDSGETSSVANIKDVGALARSNWSGYLIVGASGGSAETPKGKGTWDLVDRALEEEEEATEVADEDDDGHQIMEDEPYSVSHRSAPTGFLDEDEDDPYAVNDADNAAKVAVRESGGEAGAGKNGWLGRVGGWLGW
ncbi:hypothetical protein BC828DRAFT_397200 [Blastocladiella britannica]|nr:hypothetical protein BC828DRAFT_397200 [Blastocladiella britannica]